MDEPDGSAPWITSLIISLNYQYLIGVVLGCFVVRYAIRLAYHAATARRGKGFSYSTVGEDDPGNARGGGWYRIVAAVQWIDAWMQESPKLGLSGEWTRIRLLFTGGIIAINVLFSFIVAVQYSSMQSFAPNWIRVFTVSIGRLAMQNLPLLFALVGRSNNPISLVTGISEANSKWLHSVIGHVVFVETIVHVLGWSAYVTAGWGWSTLWLEMQMRFFIVGILATVGGVLCVVFSFRYFRPRHYEFFLVTHVLGAAMWLGGLFYHHPSCEMWVYVTAAFWILERLCRLLHNAISINLPLARFAFRQPLISATATISHGAVLLSIPFEGHWTAGQYVYVRFMGLEGGFSKTQSHPFSIVNVPRSSEKDPDSTKEIQLIIRIKQGITLTLAEYVLAHSDSTSLTSSQMMTAIDSTPFPSTCQMTVAIEGPYGNAPTPGPEEFRNIILFAGGSGVTHPAAILDELLTRVQSGEEVGTESIRLVWAIQHLDQMTWLHSQLERALVTASEYGIDLTIEIYITQSSSFVLPSPSACSTGSKAGSIHSTHSGESTPLLPLDRARLESSRIEEDDSTNRWIAENSQGRIIVRGDRPDVTSLILSRLDEIVGRTLIVGCGPESMTDKIRWCVSSLEGRRGRKDSLFEVDWNIACYDC